MSNPNGFTTDYPVEWSDVPEGFLQTGEDLVRGVVEFANGYGVSFIRTNVQRDGVEKSIGYDQGNWEVVIVRPATSSIAKMMGWQYEPAEELEHLLNDEFQGVVIGNFGNAELNDLFTQVAAADQWVAPDVEEDLMSVLAGLFGTPDEGEEESA